MFENYVNKLKILVNCVSDDVYYVIKDIVMTTHHNLYVRTPNEIFARHLLATAKQQQ